MNPDSNFAQVTAADIKMFGEKQGPWKCFATYTMLIFHLRGKHQSEDIQHHICWPSIDSLVSMSLRSRRSIRRDIQELRLADLVKTKRNRGTMTFLVRRGAISDPSWNKMGQQLACLHGPTVAHKMGQLGSYDGPLTEASTMNNKDFHSTKEKKRERKENLKRKSENSSTSKARISPSLDNKENNVYLDPQIQKIIDSAKKKQSEHKECKVTKLFG